MPGADMGDAHLAQSSLGWSAGLAEWRHDGSSPASPP
jgi:hypothetical protein